MADYQILCVNTEHPHRHIVEVGTGPELGDVTKTWSVKKVRKAIKKGKHRFYTLSPSTNKRANVGRWSCAKPGCGAVKTIRSEGDVVEDNNLDNLDPCS
jgi:Protein of unknown function (DUF3892)